MVHTVLFTIDEKSVADLGRHIRRGWQPWSFQLGAAAVLFRWCLAITHSVVNVRDDHRMSHPKTDK